MAAVAYEHVFEPLRIHGCEIPNRIARAAHQTGFARDGIGEALIAYHEARARGGVGLTILEISAVHPSSPTHLNGFDDAVQEGYGRLLPRLQAHGMRVFQQLWHGGHHYPGEGGAPPWSASNVPSVAAGLVPHPMSLAEIHEVTRAFAREAQRCREAGIDGVELHFAHGYLVGQFLSRLTNRRDDHYGGLLENRWRFAHEVLAAVRAAVGPDYPVGVRLSAEEGVAGGIGVDETLRTARSLEATGQLDFVDLSLGGYLAFSKVIGAMHEPHGYQLPLASSITRGLSLPSLVTGRFTTLAEAEQVLASGDADLVSMVRATIADPDLVNKSRSRREAEVRPCVGCNQGCVGGLQGIPGFVGCVGNPSAGFESTLPALERAARPRRVLVAGAGPAGLEAARTAAVRGHDVVVYEAAARPGGQLALARRAPHRHEIGELTDWLARELERLGVPIHLGSAVDRELVEREAPDVVLVATGSTPRRDGLQIARPDAPAAGVDRAHVYSSREVFAEGLPAVDRALVVDELGHYEAAGVAEFLLAAGSEVLLASRFQSLMPLLDLTLQTEATLARLHSSGRFQLAARRALVSVEAKTARLVDLDTGVEETQPADCVVLVAPPLPNTAVAEALDGLGCEVHLIGDARGPRFLQAAVHEAHHVARQLA
jgi:2,4-dienoyl-CoA reductase-like NADH-dependent reductase (Old Yellow Enzyme family)